VRKRAREAEENENILNSLLDMLEDVKTICYLGHLQNFGACPRYDRTLKNALSGYFLTVFRFRKFKGVNRL